MTSPRRSSTDGRNYAGMVDEPSAFAPLKELEAFLTEMESLADDDPQKTMWVGRATELVAYHKKHVAQHR